MKPKTKLKPETYEKALEYQRIGNRAVHQAREENYRLGLPQIYSRNGKIVYEMPNGDIIVREISQTNENQNS